jgi:hypothetical protein
VRVSGSASALSRASCAPPRTIGDRDDGRTVHLCVGQELRLDLASTYWRDVASSDPGVLRLSGTRVIPQSSASPCVPGAGCGIVHASFVPVAAGTVVVSAHRPVCGEALACSSAQRSFRVVVIVV